MRRGAIGLIVLALALTACDSYASTPTAPKRDAKLELRAVLATNTAHLHCGPHTVPAASKPKICYVLGPSFITQADVKTADAIYDSSLSQWVVNIDLTTSGRHRFLTGIGPLVNKEMAIVLDDHVVSAPLINPGITGGAIEI